MLIGMGPLAAGETGVGPPERRPVLRLQQGAERRRALRPAALPLRHDVVRAHVPGAVALRRRGRAAGRRRRSSPSGPTRGTTLPAELRAEVERLAAVQGHNEAERARAEDDPDVLVTTFENLQTRTTPVGYPHPRTGDDGAVRVAADDEWDRRSGPRRERSAARRAVRAPVPRRGASTSTTGATTTSSRGTTSRCSTRARTSPSKARCGRCARSSHRSRRAREPLPPEVRNRRVAKLILDDFRSPSLI